MKYMFKLSALNVYINWTVYDLLFRKKDCTQYVESLHTSHSFLHPLGVLAPQVGASGLKSYLIIYLYF